MKIAKMLSLVLAVASANAFAGKAENDKKDQLMPVVDAAAETIKTACGCAVKMDVKWEGFKEVGPMLPIRDVVNDFADMSKKYCEKPIDKKTYCENVKSLQVIFNQTPANAALKDGVVTANAGERTYSIMKDALKGL